MLECTKRISREWSQGHTGAIALNTVSLLEMDETMPHYGSSDPSVQAADHLYTRNYILHCGIMGHAVKFSMKSPSKICTCRPSLSDLIL